MIVALSISDLVLVRRFDLDTRCGFTGLTGETGAGKSIILDAIGLALGLRPDKRLVRSGAARAVVSVTFDVPPDHAVWAVLTAAGVEADPEDGLVLRRVVPSGGAARGFVNDQPVASGLLRELGTHLVEIHSQHAAAQLRRPAQHLWMLDQFASTDALLSTYQRAWHRLADARAHRQALETELAQAKADRTELRLDVDLLHQLSPTAGEVAQLALERQQRRQAGRLSDSVGEVVSQLSAGEVVERVGRSLAILQDVSRLPGFDADAGQGGGPAAILKVAAGALDRAAIELDEAERALAALASFDHADTDRLEQVEGRLFALRAAARRFGVDPDQLEDVLSAKRALLDLAAASEAALDAARQAESEAIAAWRSAATELSKARQAAAKRLEKRVGKELAALKLGKVSLRFRFDQLDDAAAGARGTDRVSMEVETNPGGGFGPLEKVASGGELARISLALTCAIAEAQRDGLTLIFDEADQGVGGAVAAAVGDRLRALGRTRQVFAITHSPQVAAAASSHWRIEKQAQSRALGQMRASVLDPKGRIEEIARMLSGAKVTGEARAAAQRLLEG